jgi:hypothetical protein
VVGEEFQAGQSYQRMYISEDFPKSSLGSAHEFTKSKTEGHGQRIGDLYSYIYRALLGKADVFAVHIREFCKVFLGGPTLRQKPERGLFTLGEGGRLQSLDLSLAL